MKNYPKELIEEFYNTELYVCECGHLTSEIETRGTGDGDYWTPEGVEEFCPECDRSDSFSEATIEDYVYQLEQEGVNIEDYN